MSYNEEREAAKTARAQAEETWARLEAIVKEMSPEVLAGICRKALADFRAARLGSPESEKLWTAYCVASWELQQRGIREPKK